MSLNKRLIASGPAPFVASENFTTVTWEGDEQDDREITVGFKPDFVWFKTRNQSNDHNLSDSTRGAAKQIRPNRDIAEVSASDQIKSFTSTGFTVGTSGDSNRAGNTYVAWCWKVGGGTTSSNTDGSGITSTVQSNADTGISIVKWTGTANASHTVGHGLGTTPDVIMLKDYSNTRNWMVHVSAAPTVNQPFGGNLDLNTTFNTNAGTNGGFGTPTSSVITFTNGSGSVNNMNASSANIIAYCFSAVSGFSHFGSYPGNGSNDGPFIETGFEPAFLMIKRTDSTGSWFIYDSHRNTSDPRTKYVQANTSNVEASDLIGVDFLSNGFKLLDDYSHLNADGGEYVYMAFAADPDTTTPTLTNSFNAIRYRGNGSTLPVSGLGFKPDFIWAKARTATNSHSMFDNLRGINKELNANSDDAQGSLDDGVLSFDSDGWTMGDRANLNQNDHDFIGWAWKAGDQQTIFGGPARAIYKFEDNTNDVTGNHNAVGSSLTGYTSSGKFNKAAQFNGSDTYINLPNGSFRYPELTVSVWVKPAGSGHRSIIENYDYQSSASKGFILRIDNSTDKARFVIYNGDCDNPYPDDTSCSNVTAAVSSSAIPTNAYTHIAVTMKLGELKMYINGELDVSTETQGIGYHASASTNIGRTVHAFSTGGEAFYNGEIDQLRVYSGCASDIDITALYAETTSDNDDLTLGEPASVLISANAAAGFSIVKYKGDGIAGLQVPHGLSVAPDMMLIKSLDTALYWAVYHKYNTGGSGNGHTERLKMNVSHSTATTSIYWNSTAPTATYFTVGTDTDTNTAGEEYIAYCFHDVSSYQKFGSYTGNGSSTGPSITTGFKPDFIFIKRADATEDYKIIDALRSFDNTIEPNENIAEESANNSNFTLTSTGFQIGDTHGDFNANNGKYVYWAIAQNVPANTTLADSFGIVEYRGLGNPRKIQGFSFRPDFVWIKNRDTDFSHSMFDTVRGAGEYVRPNTTAAEQSDSTTIQSFNSDGFSVGNAGGGIGNSGDDYIVWGWKAGNSWESNVDGSIQTLVNANTASGFSIIKYNMNLTSGTFTLGHGLSSAPQLIFFFALEQSGSTSNIVYPNIKEKEMVLDNTGAASDSNPNYWNDTAPTSTLITMGSAWTQYHSYYGGETIAYAFHSVSGFCDIDTYSGNGSTQSITGVGFRPDFVIIKETSAAESWRMFDSWRGATKRLFPNTDGVESTASDSLTSFDSDGFSLGSSAGVNESGQTYLYMAYRMNTTLNTTLANSFKNMHYTGTGAELAVTGAGFKPDLVWITNRDGTTWNNIFDSVRGSNAYLATNANSAVEHTANTMDSFDSDGFTIDSSNGFGNNNTNFAAWAWKAGNGHVSNFEGTIPSIVNANTANGFSIVKWEGTGAQGTIGHGLNSAPEIIISKRIDSTNNWNVYHKDLGLSHTSYPNWLYLNLTSSEQNSGSNANHAYYQVPSSTLIYQHTGSSESTNVDGGDYISYCWHSVSGYSKIDEYTGSGTGANQLINTGFQPDWVMFKDYSAGGSWFIVDSSRGGAKSMKANDYATEGTTNFVTFESNGFRVTGDANATSDWVYMAFKMN